MSNSEKKTNRSQRSFNGESTQPLTPVTLQCLTCRQVVNSGWDHARDYKHHSFMPAN